MSSISVIITIAAYFVILFTISYIAGRKADNEGLCCSVTVNRPGMLWHLPDWVQHLGVTYVSLRVWWLPVVFRLPANGIGICCGTVHHSIRIDATVLPDEPGIHL